MARLQRAITAEFCTANRGPLSLRAKLPLKRPPGSRWAREMRLIENKVLLVGTLIRSKSQPNYNSGDYDFFFAVFLAGAFFAVDFLVVDFFLADFFLAAFFFFGAGPWAALSANSDSASS